MHSFTEETDDETHVRFYTHDSMVLYDLGVSVLAGAGSGR